MAELADAADSKSVELKTRAGSTPAIPIQNAENLNKSKRSKCYDI